jgi:hypothetical protein
MQFARDPQPPALQPMLVRMEMDESEDYDYFPTSGEGVEEARIQAQDGLYASREELPTSGSGVEAASQSQVEAHAGEIVPPATADFVDSALQGPPLGSSNDAGFEGSSGAVAGASREIMGEKGTRAILTSSPLPGIDAEANASKRSSEESRYSDFSNSISIGDSVVGSRRSSTQLSTSISGATSRHCSAAAGTLDSPAAAAVENDFPSANSSTHGARIGQTEADAEQLEPSALPRSASSSAKAETVKLERNTSLSSVASSRHDSAESRGSRTGTLEVDNLANPGDMLRVLSSFVPKLLLQAAASAPGTATFPSNSKSTQQLCSCGNRSLVREKPSS